MAEGKEFGTLILPEWHSAPWWPLLITKQGLWQEFVRACCRFQLYDGILVPSSAASGQFASGVPPYTIVALRLSFVAE